MDKILTTDCYTTKAQSGSEHDLTIQGMVKDGRLEKHTGMIVLTKQNFEKIIKDAFDTGKKLTIAWDNYFDHDGEKPTCPDKEEYIETILR